MDELSGGEKTVAALALLFTIYRCERGSQDLYPRLKYPRSYEPRLFYSGQSRRYAQQYECCQDCKLHREARV